MNYRMTAYLLGEILIIVAALMLIPFVMTFCYGEENTALGFGITIAAMLAVGVPSVTIKKPKNTEMKARGGFIVVALAWVFLSAFSAMPFTISGYIPSFLDSLFEMVSGYTTTGATILSDVEIMPKSLLFWRSFTHWLGGMGVLVFVIAILPKSSAAVVHLAKAEIPGPQFGKLVSKLRFTARILYGIYVILTLLQAVLLMIGKMPVFDSFIHAFGTAGTGGFSNKNLSLAYYDNLYYDIIVSIFMLIFSMNFNLFYFILIGNVRQAVTNEELRWLLSYVLVAIILVSASLMMNNVYASFGETLRYSVFQVLSISSTSGFATADFATWPIFAQLVLFVCMFFGGMAGSTAGGLKVSRIMILSKSAKRSIVKSISPRTVKNIKIDKKPIDESLAIGVQTYFAVYMVIFFLSLAIVAIFGKETDGGAFTTYVTAVASCLNNVGPGLGGVGPLCNYGGLSVLTKIVLIFDMLIGRLEIFPIILLFYPKSWAKV